MRERFTSALVVLVMSSCAATVTVPVAAQHLAVPPKPANCQTVSTSEDAVALFAAATPGTNFCLPEGTWQGQFVVPEGVRVYGTSKSVLKTKGTGTTVLLHSNSALLGVTVDGSGGRFDIVDAAVMVHGDDVLVEGVTVRNSIFGILVEKSKRATIRGNFVIGTGDPALGMRGDGIRLWETYDSDVSENRVEDARDCVVWYSSRNTLHHNDVRRGRYGIHLMYSHQNILENNQFIENEVGIFLMYSRGVVVRDNELMLSKGAAGIGLGLKESGNITVTNNLFVHNTQGIFIDNSPLVLGDANRYEGNTIRLSDVGIGFLSSGERNTFSANHLIDNRIQVRVDGNGDALTAQWQGNEWSDYAGYDLDGDGYGDIPYELKDLSAKLVGKYPDLTYLTGTPALALISLVGDVVPLFAPRPLLHDDRPYFGGKRAH